MIFHLSVFFYHDYLFLQSKDYEKVKKTLTSIPPVAELVQIEPGALKRKLDERNPLAYPLLQWYVGRRRGNSIANHLKTIELSISKVQLH